MSKFLKLIVDLVIICTILIAAALLVPPLAGVKTVMNDNSTAETNLPVGSVAYGKQTDAVNLKKGQKIVYTKNNQAYVYEISDVSDAENDTYLVKDAYDKKTEERSVELSGDVMKLSFVVPLIAYAAIAVQSKEGLILIGLGIVFLIILFILAELWRKDKKDMEETKWFFVTDDYIYWKKKYYIAQVNIRSGKKKIVAEGVADDKVTYVKGIIKYIDAEENMRTCRCE